MSKAINDELRQANVGKFINVNDVLNAPIRLFLVYIVPKTITFQSTGKSFDSNEFGFVTETDNEKIITDFANGSLWQAIDKLDPEKGQLLEIWSEEVEGFKYPQWRARAVEGVIKPELADNYTPRKTNAVNDTNGSGNITENGAGNEDEEIKLEDIPF